MPDSPRDGNNPAGTPSGYVCSTCGGALWERSDDDGQNAFQCRIGHDFSADQLWVEHCTRRNRALASAARSLAENAALASDLAELARALGKQPLATRLEQEAARERQNFEQLQVMLETLAQDDSTA
jgi:hypothetical protein